MSQAQQYTDDVTDLEYAKFRKSKDNRSLIAVTIEPSATQNYDSTEFAIGNATTDYNIASNQASAFLRVPTALKFNIRTDRRITVKINTNTDPGITVDAIDSPFELSIPTTNLFITNNSGATANIRLILM